jgi:hypothetical protein
MTSDKLNHLRNQLYDLLHDEIRATMALSAPAVGSETKPQLYSVNEGEK